MKEPIPKGRGLIKDLSRSTLPYPSLEGRGKSKNPFLKGGDLVKTRAAAPSPNPP
jgi:hypothetical protein